MRGNRTMKSLALMSVTWGWLCALPALATAADALPFQHKVEVYRNKEGDVTVFTVRLEQPFLAEEFDKSNYLRLQSADPRAYLIYPKETKFQQKHAEFYGRLRGEGKVTLKLSYEIVSENIDGTRRVAVRHGEIEVPIPAEPVGPTSIFRDWANQQNAYFAELLRYYPEESFFQYCLLQSRARYGVNPPAIPKAMPGGEELETNLYQFASGSLAIQESLQREALSSRARVGELSRHISTLSPPNLKSLPYKELLEEKRTREKIEPAVHELAKLVPEDQYFLHFNSMRSLFELLDFSTQWGDSLLRLFTVRAQDPQTQAKLEDQLCVRRDPLMQLFAAAVISEVALTGADPFVREGTDVTMIFRLKQPELFRKAAAGWLEDVRKKRPDMEHQEFNYRGHKGVTHYTKDRVVSSFVVEHGDTIIYSTSPRAIRAIIDAATGAAPSLYDALDYRYVSTIMPPQKTADSGYLFVSEATIRRLIGPAAKISEKRRMQCFNNLVMLNNASLFFRLEYGRMPESLSELVQGRFVDADKIVCPHGGAYAFDAQSDTCTCSLHNRLKYLTPNCELSVLNISQEEAAEYERYKQRYQAFWQQTFDPIAMRITVGPRMKLESCVLPFANGSFYAELRSMLDKKPLPLGTGRIAPSAVVSIAAVPGREKIAQTLIGIPGVAETLKANPTLTDLKWLGDRMSLHYCDGEVLEIDPLQLRPTSVPFIGKVPVETQAVVAARLAATKLPVYVTIDVENRESAARLLEQLSQQIFLKKEDLAGIPTTLDAYRLPDYKGHAIYVFSAQVYAMKIRLHAALVGDQLVAATKPEVLHQVIDAAEEKETRPPAPAHLLVRLNRRGLGRLHDEFQLYWAEKARIACEHNIGSIYNLYKLYNTPIDQIPRLSDAKYGVRYFCPDHGEYAYDAQRDRVVCSVHGNREQARQNPRLDRKSSFAEFMEGLEEIVATLRFQDDALLATVEIARSSGEKKKPDSP